METLGSVAGTQNIDRILRLPGTINLPNAKKLREGRTACPAKLIKFNGATCRLEDFPTAAAEPPPGNDGSKHRQRRLRATHEANNQSTSIDWAKVDPARRMAEERQRPAREFQPEGQDDRRAQRQLSAT